MQCNDYAGGGQVGRLVNTLVGWLSAAAPTAAVASPPRSLANPLIGAAPDAPLSAYSWQRQRLPEPEAEVEADANPQRTASASPRTYSLRQQPPAPALQEAAGEGTTVPRSWGSVHCVPACRACRLAELPTCECGSTGPPAAQPAAAAPRPRLFSFELPAAEADARAAGGPKRAPKSGFDPLGHLEAPPSESSTPRNDILTPQTSLESLKLSTPRSEASTPAARGGTKVRLARDGGVELCTIKVTCHGRHCHSGKT